MAYTNDDRERSIKMYTILERVERRVDTHDEEIDNLKSNQLKGFFGQGILGGVVAFCTAYLTK